jgi:nucleoside-diphosphate-sugar epimerase
MSQSIDGATVLVTGAAGTVGSEVAKRLVMRGARVRAGMHSHAAKIDGAEVVAADLTDAASLRGAVDGCDLVVHCAAAVSQDPAACRALNVDGVGNVLTALREAPAAKLVHISTVSVYDWRKGTRLDEDSAMWTEQLDPYGFTKAESERLIRDAVPDAVILRLVMVLSMHPRSYWGPLALARAAASDAPVMPLPTVPYVDVGNIATAVELAATTPAARGRVYNVIDGEGDAARYMAAVYGAIGKPAPPVATNMPHFVFDGTRIRRELGYAPVDRWEAFLGELASHQAQATKSA